LKDIEAAVRRIDEEVVVRISGNFSSLKEEVLLRLFLLGGIGVNSGKLSCSEAGSPIKKDVLFYPRLSFWGKPVFLGGRIF
jgi:hypothetical protein